MGDYYLCCPAILTNTLVPQPSLSSILQNQLGVALDALTEYLSYEFGLHLKQCGIVSQLMPPGTPQRNGVFVGERSNFNKIPTHTQDHVDA